MHLFPLRAFMACSVLKLVTALTEYTRLQLSYIVDFFVPQLIRFAP